MHLNKLFDKLRQHKFYVHPRKCEFMCDKLSYLGQGMMSTVGIFRLVD